MARGLTNKIDLKESLSYRMARGRRPVTIKDPNKQRIWNPCGRTIDVGGPAYNNYIRNGYIPNPKNTQLIKDINFSKTLIKVINPLTYRKIVVNGPTFFKVLRNERYKYNAEHNIINTYIAHPKRENYRIIKDGEEFNKFIQKGYIYKDNALQKPSRLSEKAFKNGVKKYEFIVMNEHDPIQQMKIVEKRVKTLLLKELEKLRGIKFNIELGITMIKHDQEQEFFFKAKTDQLTEKNSITEAMNIQRDRVLTRIDRFTMQGSGWTIHRINSHFLSINQYKPLRGHGYILLPKAINNKKATVNIQNEDDKCFIYCLGRALDSDPEVKNLDRVSKHLKEVCSKLGFDRIETPVNLKNLTKIEDQFEISINIFGHKESEIYPLVLTKKRLTYEDYKKHVDLLVTTKDDVQYHYVWIKNFDKLNYCISKHKGKKYFCKNCVNPFGSEDLLKKHVPDCMEMNGIQAAKYPEEGSKLKFESLRKTIPIPFVIYADLEAILPPVPEVAREVKENEDIKVINTVKTQEHTACSHGYKVVCLENDKYSKPLKIFRGENAVYKFFEALFQEELEINENMKEFYDSKPQMTKENWNNFNNAKHCYVCKCTLNEKIIQYDYVREYCGVSCIKCNTSNKLRSTDKMTKENWRNFYEAKHCNACECTFNEKIREHNHITGEYRGACCKKCNDNLRLSHKIPVIFHNLRGYDSHHLMQELGRFRKEINVIPNNMEKYMSFSVGTRKKYHDWEKEEHLKYDLCFIDSFQFMSSCLENLVKDLKHGGLEKFKYTREEFGKNTDMMTRKGVYPYTFMSDWDKFNINTNYLKPKHFTNDLTGDKISYSDYFFYHEVCRTFNITDIGEYHDLYLKTDVLLLADVFENFRKTCLEYYGLDPCHYFSAPGLSWDALLKMTGIELELLSDPNMYLFIEKGLRGGVSIITHRKGIANNKYMKNYDEGKPSKHILYLDTTNLYGWGMTLNLPYGGFKWINPEEFDIENGKCNSEIGHILEVNLEYPKELHDEHNEYPYCPEHVTVTPDMLSPYGKEIAKQQDIKSSCITKLIPTLSNKERYVIHERNLKQAIDGGLILKKIHRVLQFNQKPWMKPYIDFNTEKRTQAKNEFEKNFFKLMNVSVFGKSMENVRKRQNVKLITDENMFLKYASKPTFINGKIFNENLVAVHYVKEKLVLDKPIYVGFSILDLSKTLMYDFHYGYIKHNYGTRAKLLFTDTDSLCYEIETEDVYEDIYHDKELFDLSDIQGKFHDGSNKKVVGKMKVEYPKEIITEFIGLRSKMYSLQFDSGKVDKKAKGIVKSVIRKNLKHSMYANILEKGSNMYSKMKVIRSTKHHVYTMEQNKLSLSAYDDKRWIHDDGITSYAHGHYKTW